MASLGHGEEALAVFKEVHGAATGAITFDEYCAAWKSFRAPRAIEAMLSPQLRRLDGVEVT